MKFGLIFLSLALSATLKAGGNGGDQIPEANGRTLLSLESVYTGPKRAISQKLDQAIEILHSKIEEKNKKSSKEMALVLNTIEKELLSLKNDRKTKFFLIEKNFIPVVENSRCGYKAMTVANALTYPAPGSPIYFSEKFLVKNSETEIAKVLFHEIFRHNLGDILNCYLKYIHNTTNYIFDVPSAILPKEIGTIFLLFGRNIELVQRDLLFTPGISKKWTKSLLRYPELAKIIFNRDVSLVGFQNVFTNLTGDDSLFELYINHILRKGKFDSRLLHLKIADSLLDITLQIPAESKEQQNYALGVARRTLKRRIGKILKIMPGNLKQNSEALLFEIDMILAKYNVSPQGVTLLSSIKHFIRELAAEEAC